MKVSRKSWHFRYLTIFFPASKLTDKRYGLKNGWEYPATLIMMVPVGIVWLFGLGLLVVVSAPFLAISKALDGLEFVD